ncbi:hypothetical protein E5S67_02446 [Microcoleus sp. IPMA8]|uniref:Uncharacterized protein n=1 Tax=Microcoleus asticus IPMA8 TaxID=2563858 RepID=A0ABX2CX36_9CYAN|nr:hypothetical protein [Microcoleus asticus IPMA8]
MSKAKAIVTRATNQMARFRSDKKISEISVISLNPCSEMVSEIGQEL